MKITKGKHLLTNIQKINITIRGRKVSTNIMLMNPKRTSQSLLRMVVKIKATQVTSKKMSMVVILNTPGNHENIANKIKDIRVPLVLFKFKHPNLIPALTRGLRNI